MVARELIMYEYLYSGQNPNTPYNAHYSILYGSKNEQENFIKGIKLKLRTWNNVIRILWHSSIMMKGTVTFSVLCFFSYFPSPVTCIQSTSISCTSKWSN